MEDADRFISSFPTHSGWPQNLIPAPDDISQSFKTNTPFHIHTKGPRAYVFFVARLPTGHHPHAKNPFEMIMWCEYRIAWIMIDGKRANTAQRWMAMHYFSMLPYGWIPDNGVDFFVLFISFLEKKWLHLCDLGEEELNECVSRSKPSTNQYIHVLTLV
jgi:hypothetical protein